MKPSHYWQRRRSGIVMSSMQFDVLAFLRDAKAQDMPFIHLPGVYKRTLNSMVAQDWIFASPGSDGTRYKITHRGERALKIFTPVLRRDDGLCPTCGLRPRRIKADGKYYGYCVPCESVYKKAMYRLGRHRIDPDRLCSSCKKRPLHRMSGGKLSTYCTECRHDQRKAEKRAQHDRDLARIAAGEILLCRACKKEPRCYTERYVRDRCSACQKIYMDEYNARRRSQECKYDQPQH